MTISLGNKRLKLSVTQKIARKSKGKSEIFTSYITHIRQRENEFLLRGSGSIQSTPKTVYQDKMKFWKEQMFVRS